MPDQRVCTAQEIEDNAKEAEKTGHTYGAVEVMITRRWTGDGGKTWSIELVRRGDEKGKRYEATWGSTAQMWAACPSSLPSKAKPGTPGDAPPVGAFGKLYLSDTYLATYDMPEDPKWPLRLGATEPPSLELEVYPLALELTAVETRSGKFVKATVDLLDPVYARPTQTVVLDGASPLKLQLTEESFRKFLLPFVPDAARIKEALAIAQAPTGHSQSKIAAAWGVLASTASMIAGGDVTTLDAATRADVEAFLKLR